MAILGDAQLLRKVLPTEAAGRAQSQRSTPPDDLGMRITLAPARDGDEVRSIGRAEANHSRPVGIARTHFQGCLRLRRANAEVACKRTRLPHLQIATDAEIPNSEIFTTVLMGGWSESRGKVVEVSIADFIAVLIPRMVVSLNFYS